MDETEKYLSIHNASTNHDYLRRYQKSNIEAELCQIKRN